MLQYLLTLIKKVYMSGQATSLEELRKLIARPQQIINNHLEDVKKSGGKPIQMPQAVTKPVVVQPVQQVPPVQQPKPVIANPTIVPPKKGGCGCWGKK